MAVSLVYDYHLVPILLCCFSLQLHPVPFSIITADPALWDMLSCYSTNSQKHVIGPQNYFVFIKEINALAFSLDSATDYFSVQGKDWRSHLSRFL